MRMIINMSIEQTSFHSVSGETSMLIFNKGRRRPIPIATGKKLSAKNNKMHDFHMGYGTTPTKICQ